MITTMKRFGPALLALCGVMTLGQARASLTLDYVYNQEFPSGGNTEVLIREDLLQAGSRSSLTFAITVDYDALTSDNDPVFGISDGTSFVGVQRADNNGGSFYRIAAADGGTTLSGVANGQLKNGLGSVQTFTFTLSASDGTDGTRLVGYQEGSNGFSPAYQYGRTLDTDRALSFVFAGRDSRERYRLNSVRITISGENLPAALSVPEPSTLAAALVGSALLGAGYVRRRRTTA